MSLKFTQIVQATTAGDSTTQLTVPSQTVAANSLAILTIVTRHNSAVATNETYTITGTMGLTWTNRKEEVVGTTNVTRTAVFTAPVGGSGATGTIIVQWPTAANGSMRMQYALSRANGYNTTTPVVQAVSTNGRSNTANYNVKPNFANATDNRNRFYMATTAESTSSGNLPIVPPLWNELGAAGTSASGEYLETAWRQYQPDTTGQAQIALTNTNYSCIGLEIGATTEIDIESIVDSTVASSSSSSDATPSRSYDCDGAIILAIQASLAGGAPSYTPSGMSLTWVQVDEVSNGNLKMSLWYAKTPLASGPSGTVTLTPSPAVGGATLAFSLDQMQGFDPITPVSATNEVKDSATGVTTKTLTLPSATPNSTHDRIYAAFGYDNGSFVADTGFTSLGAIAATNNKLGTEWNPTAFQQATTCGATTSGTIQGIAVEVQWPSPIVPITGTETGSGADTATITTKGTETGSGADTSTGTTALETADTEAGTGADTSLPIQIGKADDELGNFDEGAILKVSGLTDTETGTTQDSQQADAELTGTETGSTVETQSPTADETGAETAGLADEETVHHDLEFLTDTEGATTTDQEEVGHPQTEAGTEADSGAVTILQQNIEEAESAQATDEGVASEQLFSPDTGAALEGAITEATTGADAGEAGTVAETELQEDKTTQARSDDDTGTGLDIAGQTAAQTDSDSADVIDSESLTILKSDSETGVSAESTQASSPMRGSETGQGKDFGTVDEIVHGVVSQDTVRARDALDIALTPDPGDSQDRNITLSEDAFSDDTEAAISGDSDDVETGALAEDSLVESAQADGESGGPATEGESTLADISDTESATSLESSLLEILDSELAGFSEGETARNIQPAKGAGRIKISNRKSTVRVSTSHTPTVRVVVRPL